MQATYDRYRAAVDEALRAHPLLGGAWPDTTIAPQSPPPEGQIPQPLRSAMRYSLLLPGKRLRPVLLLAAYALCCDDMSPALPYALALEMIHTYSLIHDDLPAMDDDDLRRGKPTNHRVYGENMAILAGDGLYSLALETMLAAALTAKQPARAVAAMEEIARRAGVTGMIAGQSLDVRLEGVAPDAPMVAYIHRHKTADLMTAPVVAGLLLAGASDVLLSAGKAYGQALGLAFQIVDDLMDVQGDAQTMGKHTGMDAQRGKLTWPAVYGAEASRAMAARCVAEAVDALAPFGEKADFLTELARDSLTRVS
jgi:geranylgeranyl diphosphate synthase type II